MIRYCLPLAAYSCYAAVYHITCRHFIIFTYADYMPLPHKRALAIITLRHMSIAAFWLRFSYAIGYWRRRHMANIMWCYAMPAICYMAYVTLGYGHAIFSCQKLRFRYAGDTPLATIDHWDQTSTTMPALAMPAAMKGAEVTLLPLYIITTYKMPRCWRLRCYATRYAMMTLPYATTRHCFIIRYVPAPIHTIDTAAIIAFCYILPPIIGWEPSHTMPLPSWHCRPPGYHRYAFRRSSLPQLTPKKIRFFITTLPSLATPFSPLRYRYCITPSLPPEYHTPVSYFAVSPLYLHYAIGQRRCSAEPLLYDAEYSHADITSFRCHWWALMSLLPYVFIITGH